MEAFLSLLAAFLLLSFIPLTYSAQKFSYSSVVSYQRANDIAEVLWAAGDYTRIGDWLEGDESSKETVKQRLESISNETGLCIKLEVKEKGKRIEAGCNGKEKGDVTSVSRIIVSGKGIHGMQLSIS